MERREREQTYWLTLNRSTSPLIRPSPVIYVERNQSQGMDWGITGKENIHHKNVRNETVLKFWWNESISHSKTAKNYKISIPAVHKDWNHRICFFYLKVIAWLIGYWISTTTKEGFLFAGQKFRFDWCSWNFFCPSTQNGNVWDIRDKIYLWIIFFREPQTKDISPAETKKYIKMNSGVLPEEKRNWRGITLSGLFQRLI